MLEKINKTVSDAIIKNIADETALEKINKHTLKPFTAEQVFTFKAVACDNEIDRDTEQFSDSALDKLALLFNGKSVILDHFATAKNQTARIYAAEVEQVAERFNSLGQPYKRLVVYCYMPITEKNADTITEIEAGIKKEVSVGIACSAVVCSICGVNKREKGCKHIKRQKYGDKTCHYILDNPTDAYELSFVAIPAQKGAGVTKGMNEQSNVITDSPEALRLKTQILYNM